MKYLETFGVSETPEVVQETIIDEMFSFFCVFMWNEDAKKRKHYINDRFLNHFWCFWNCGEDRGSFRGFYSIKGTTQIRPSGWGEALKNKTFKESLLGFSFEAWKGENLLLWLLCKNFKEENSLCQL